MNTQEPRDGHPCWMRDVMAKISKAKWDGVFGPIIGRAHNLLPYRLAYEMSQYQFYTFPDKRQPMDDAVHDIEPYFQELRDSMPRTVRLYRGQATENPPIKRDFLSWTISGPRAAEYALHLESPTVFCADVARDDVLAAFASPPELLVRNQLAYLTSWDSVPAAVVSPDWWEWSCDRAEHDGEYDTEDELEALIGPEPERYIYFDDVDDARDAGFEEYEIKFDPSLFDECD